MKSMTSHSFVVALVTPLEVHRVVASPSLASGAVLLPDDDAIGRYVAISQTPNVGGLPTRSANLLSSKRAD